MASMGLLLLVVGCSTLALHPSDVFGAVNEALESPEAAEVDR